MHIQTSQKETPRKRLLSLGSRPARRPLIGMLLLALVISACGAPDRAAPATQAPVAQAATATPPTRTPLPTAALQPATVQPIPLTTPQQGQVAATPIPACIFNAAAGPEPQVPGLDAYTFSEPKVILTDQLIGISEWLPDNQRLLISRSFDGGKREAFETIDVRAGTTQRYAEQARYRTKPVWLEAEQAVAFADILATNQVVLRISRRPGAPVEDVATDLASPFLAVSADGQQLTFTSRADRGQPRVMRAGQSRQTRILAGPTRDSGTQPVPVLLNEWNALRAAWRPDGKQIAFYNKAGIYLTDTTTGQDCKVDLGGDNTGQRWPLNMRWSPDSRFLAALTSIGGRVGQLAFVDLTILDTTTGALSYADLGVQYIFEFAWLPNSRQVVALGQTGSDEQGDQLGLFVANVLTSEMHRMLPEHIFRVGIYGATSGALALSHDGQRIAARCPSFAIQSLDSVKDQLCLLVLRIRSAPEHQIVPYQALMKASLLAVMRGDASTWSQPLGARQSLLDESPWHRSLERHVAAPRADPHPLLYRHRHP
jgi:Tol biopolymer transport system component